MLPLLAPLATALQPATAAVTAPGSPVGTAWTSGSGQYAVKQAAPHLLEDEEDAYAAGLTLGLSETAIGGADPLFATTKNIELMGGPSWGFGGSGQGFRRNVEQHIPGASQAAPFVETYLDPGGIQGNAAPTRSTSVGFEPGMLLGGEGLSMAPALSPDPGPTPTFGAHLTRNPQVTGYTPPPQIDYSKIDYSSQQSLPQPPPLMSLPQPVAPPYIPDELYMVDQFGNPVGP